MEHQWSDGPLHKWARKNSILIGRCITIGGILCNHEQDVLAAYPESIPYTDPLQAKLHALLMGIEVGIALHVDNIILEGECMIILETLQQLGSFLWELMQDGKKNLKVLTPEQYQQWSP